jgi:hypothetical protein
MQTLWIASSGITIRRSMEGGTTDRLAPEDRGAALRDSSAGCRSFLSATRRTVESARPDHHAVLALSGDPQTDRAPGRTDHAEAPARTHASSWIGLPPQESCRDAAAGGPTMR